MKNIITTCNLPRLITVGAVAMALQGSAANAQPGLAQFLRVPPVPHNIEAPAGHRAFLKGHAIGTQNYVCMPSGWTFLGPQATVFVTFPWIRGEVRQQIATHFLSANPKEGGTPRPVWQGSADTSAAWAKSIANSSDPSFVTPGAIPWLLLEVTGSQHGPTGGSLLSETTYIQRVNTSGGITPTTACTVGSITLVPYTADYFFYKPGR